jgi:hypothetical protein
MFENTEFVTINKIAVGDCIFFEGVWQTATKTTVNHFKSCFEFSPIYYSKETEKVKRAITH